MPARAAAWTAALPRQVLLAAIAVICLEPVVFVLMTSLKSPDEYAVNRAGWPARPTLANYVEALADLPTLRWALNSAVVTSGSVLMSLVLAAPAAYAITFGEFHGRSLLLGANVGLIMVPPVALVLPVFVVMVNLGLINNLLSLVILYSCLLVPFSVFFLCNFFRTIPPELAEAGAIDGAGPVQLLWRVVLPLSRPAMLTLAVVNAIWAWNELLIALVFIQNESRRTLMAGLSLLQGRYSTNQPLVLAVASLSMLPVALFYLFSQRSFVRGLTAGIGR
ncbi:MAG: raffinose/stachyose/melibiose transport system permease protein [Mycobacteriales bacterium]